MKNLFIKHHLLLMLCAVAAMAQIFISCKKANLIDTANSDKGTINSTPLIANSGTPVNPTPWICISNTADKTIEVYNSNVTTWNSSTAYWIFKPTTALGYSSGAITALGGGVGDQRMHASTAFPDKAHSIFAIQGGRYLAIGIFNPVGTHQRGEKLWECTIPSAYDPNNHAIEILPNGNLVVAGYGKTDATLIGNWIRIYNTSTADTTHHVQTYLNGAHALYWDAGMNRLWAGGQIKISGTEYHGIFAYIIGGTRTAPTITEDVSLRKVLPYPPNGNPSSPTGPPDHLQWPHDIMPDYDNSNILYYADHSGVYVFDKTALTLTPTPGTSHCYTGTDVAIKSACKMAGSYITVTKINDAANHPYETNQVEFYNPTSGSLAFNRTVAGYTIYRSRIWEIPVFKPFGFTDGSKSILGVYYQGTWKFIGKPDLSYGQPTDIPVPGDYDGDGITENAVWNSGSPYMWSIPTGANYNYGTTGDIPVPADYNGDGHTDVAVWRPSTFRWYITTAGDVDWGQAGDIPVPADYDGDGKADVAIWRPATGQWYVYGGGNIAWGTTGDIPVPADYLGQGFVQKAVFRPSDHTWHVYGQTAVTMSNYSAGDIPVPGDYDGDGKVDKALYRPSTGQLYVNGVLTGTVTGATSNYKPLNLPYCIRKFFFP